MPSPCSFNMVKIPVWAICIAWKQCSEWRAHHEVVRPMHCMEAMHWRAHRDVATSRCGESSIAWLCSLYHAMYRRSALPWSNALRGERIATSRRCEESNVMHWVECYAVMHCTVHAVRWAWAGPPWEKGAKRICSQG